MFTYDFLLHTSILYILIFFHRSICIVCYSWYDFGVSTTQTSWLLLNRNTLIFDSNVWCVYAVQTKQDINTNEDNINTCIKFRLSNKCWDYHRLRTRFDYETIRLERNNDKLAEYVLFPPFMCHNPIKQKNPVTIRPNPRKSGAI